jgi:hypothetical protein
VGIPISSPDAGSGHHYQNTPDHIVKFAWASLKKLSQQLAMLISALLNPTSIAFKSFNTIISPLSYLFSLPLDFCSSCKGQRAKELASEPLF